MTANEKKTFVLDTNVILHDYRSIYNFTNNDIVIPIVVLEELDKFKKGNDLINFHAREFARELDKISEKDFFDKGEKYIKPMKMKDIAQNLDFHESTISRGVNRKYMLTPFGIYEFKYFFSSALETNYDNLASSVSIKRMIQETIKSENKKKPLSDDQISKILKDRWINIARRTIAKYREELGILSSSKRKQY